MFKTEVSVIWNFTCYLKWGIPLFRSDSLSLPPWFYYRHPTFGPYGRIWLHKLRALWNPPIPKSQLAGKRSMTLLPLKRSQDQTSYHISPSARWPNATLFSYFYPSPETQVNEKVRTEIFRSLFNSTRSDWPGIRAVFRRIEKFPTESSL